MLTTILAFIVALGIIITFHEYGHYWAARRCGVRVLRFSVGFGKPLLKRVDRHGTEWVVAGIPLGGYVKMQDEPEPGATEDEARATFSRQPLKNRFFIVSAGPIANFILAAVIYAALNMMGTEEPAAVLAEPPAASAAAAAGIQDGDRVVAVNGTPVASWSQMRWQMLDDMVHGRTARLTVERGGGNIDVPVALTPMGSDPEADVLGLTGLRLQAGQTRITNVQTNSAAAQAGLAANDLVESINGVPITNTQSLIEQVQAHPGQPVEMVVRRDNQLLSLAVTPSAQEQPGGGSVGRIGVGLASDVQMVTIEHGIIQSTWLGITRTVETAWFSLRMLGNMVVGVVSWKNISGPVTIADYAGQTAQMGLVAYLAFLALVSVSIGVLNLLPIPMLDGGHLMYYVVEMIRGKPTPERWMEIGQRFGIIVIGGLMTLAIFNDLTRLFG